MLHVAVLAASSFATRPPTKNWHAAKAAAHDSLIVLVQNSLRDGPRQLPAEDVYVERAVHTLPRESGLPSAPSGLGLLTPDLVAIDAKSAELLIIEVTICPDGALGKYASRKAQKYRALCRLAAQESSLRVAPPLIVAVGTSGHLPDGTRAAIAALLSESADEGQLQHVLDEASAIARTRPDAPRLALPLDAKPTPGRRRQGRSTRRQRRAAAAGVCMMASSLLPESLQVLLPAAAVNDPAVVPLWRALRKCYPSEAAALEAAERNPGLLLPWANSPETISGSFAMLCRKMEAAAVLDVITKNPGVLSCDPQRLAISSAEEIQTVAATTAAIGAARTPLALAALALAVLGAAAGTSGGPLDADVAQSILRPAVGAIGASAFFAALGGAIAAQRR